jgi:hypothetical protein
MTRFDCPGLVFDTHGPEHERQLLRSFGVAVSPDDRAATYTLATPWPAPDAANRVDR